MDTPTISDDFGVNYTENMRDFTLLYGEWQSISLIFTIWITAAGAA